MLVMLFELKKKQLELKTNVYFCEYGGWVDIDLQLYIDIL